MDQSTVVLAPVEASPEQIAQPVARPATQPATVGERSRPRWPGILSFALALLTLTGLVTGLVLVVQDQYAAATYAAWIATGVSAAAVVLAVVALAGRFGRGWALAGLVLAVVANPPALTWLLGAIGGLWA